MIKHLLCLFAFSVAMIAGSDDPKSVIVSVNEDGKVTSFELTAEAVSAWRKLYAESKVAGSFTDQYIAYHESNTAVLIGLDKFTPDSVKPEVEAARKAEQARLLKIQSASKVRVIEKKGKD